MTMAGKHWGMTDLRNGFANIYCPTIHEDKVEGFKVKREIYREFKELETNLKAAGFRGWVSWTKLENSHIMKFLAKLRALPYGIDVKKETIWFRKEL